MAFKMKGPSLYRKSPIKQAGDFGTFAAMGKSQGAVSTTAIDPGKYFKEDPRLKKKKNKTPESNTEKETDPTDSNEIMAV